jgi:hypothetical protein
MDRDPANNVIWIIQLSERANSPSREFPGHPEATRRRNSGNHFAFKVKLLSITGRNGKNFRDFALIRDHHQHLSGEIDFHVRAAAFTRFGPAGISQSPHVIGRQPTSALAVLDLLKSDQTVA